MRNAEKHAAEASPLSRSKRTSFKSAALGTVLGLGLVMGATASPADAAERFILAHAMPENHIFHRISTKFMDGLKANCEGEFRVNYHPGGDLGDWASQFEQVMTGAFPMTMAWAHSEFDGRLDVSFLGYIVDDWEKGRALYGPGGKMQEFYNQILGELNLVMLGTVPTDFGGIAMRKGDERVPLDYPGDAKGINVRVATVPIAPVRYAALGFDVTPLPFSELYTALQLGTVDGRTFAPPSEIWQMRDVIETYILTREYFEHAFWLVNKDWFEDLDDDQRQCMTTAADAAIAWSWDAAESESVEWLVKIKGYGINVIEPTPEQIDKIKKIIYEVEWPWMEEILGAELMAELKVVAGIE